MSDLWIDSNKFRLPFVAVVKNQVDYRTVTGLCDVVDVNDTRTVTDNATLLTVMTAKGLVSIVTLHDLSGLTKSDMHAMYVQVAMGIVDDFHSFNGILNPDKIFTSIAVSSIFQGLIDNDDIKLSSAMY